MLFIGCYAVFCWIWAMRNLQGQAVVMSCFCNVRMIWLAARVEGDVSIKMAQWETVEHIKGGGATLLMYCWLNSLLLCVTFSSITNARKEQQKPQPSWIEEAGAFLLSTRWQMHLDRILAVWRFLLFGRRGKRTFIGRQNTNHHNWDSVSAPRHSNKRNEILHMLCNGWNALLTEVVNILWNWSRTSFTTENSTVAMPYVSGQGQGRLTGNGLFQWKWTASRRTDHTEWTCDLLMGCRSEGRSHWQQLCNLKSSLFMRLEDF